MASYNISITGKRRSKNNAKNNVRRPSAAVKRTSTLGSEDQKEEEEESMQPKNTSTGDIQLAMYGGETAYTSSSKKTQKIRMVRTLPV